MSIQYTGTIEGLQTTRKCRDTTILGSSLRKMGNQKWPLILH